MSINKITKERISYSVNIDPFKFSSIIHLSLFTPELDL